MHELKSISTTILQHETQVLRLSSEDEIYMSCNWNSGDAGSKAPPNEETALKKV